MQDIEGRIYPGNVRGETWRAKIREGSGLMGYVRQDSREERDRQWYEFMGDVEWNRWIGNGRMPYRENPNHPPIWAAYITGSTGRDNVYVQVIKEEMWKAYRTTRNFPAPQKTFYRHGTTGEISVYRPKLCGRDKVCEEQDKQLKEEGESPQVNRRRSKRRKKGVG